MKATDLIRRFCEENSDKYQIYENYSSRWMSGKTCLGVVVRNGNSYLEMLSALTAYLNDYANDIDLEFSEGLSADNLGLDTIVYFPHIKG